MASNEPKLPLNPFAGKVWVFIGTAVAICGLIWPLKRAWFVLNANRAPGRIVKIQIVSTDDGDAYRPFVDFVDARGEEHTMRSNLAYGWKRFDSGQQVEVLYDPSGSGQVEINSLFWLWGGPILSMSLCLLCGSLPWLERRYHKRTSWVYAR